ncbi:hypothetical protein F5878DRAFT_666534 [Lentinula raphanica]|uniref:Ubinuclein middle domain-containing protein n=1 Tax=Lentinula raphanica TaxID=153919 RepID=A0AA38U513_9AGAR|nr:hypothetical protein F5878DRAFT_666534 [Lentinula raphanica]
MTRSPVSRALALLFLGAVLSVLAAPTSIRPSPMSSIEARTLESRPSSPSGQGSLSGDQTPVTTPQRHGDEDGFVPHSPLSGNSPSPGSPMYSEAGPSRDAAGTTATEREATDKKLETDDKELQEFLPKITQIEAESENLAQVTLARCREIVKYLKKMLADSNLIEMAGHFDDVYEIPKDASSKAQEAHEQAEKLLAIYEPRLAQLKKEEKLALSKKGAEPAQLGNGAGCTIRSTSSRTLAILFLGAAISSSVLAAPTPLPALSISSNPASSGAHPGGSVYADAVSQQLGDDFSTVEISKPNQNGTDSEDVKDPGVSVTLVNLKNRVVSTDGSDPSPGGSDSLRTSATKAVIDPSILEELRDWSDKVHKKVTKWLATDSQAKRLYLPNLDQLVLDEAGIAEFAPSQSSDPGGKRRLDEHWQVTDWQLPPSQSHRPNSKGGGRKIHNVKTSEADDEEEEEEEEEKRDPESLGSSIRQSPKGLDKQRAKNPASLLGNGDDRNLLKSTLDTAQEARRLYAVRDDLLNDAMENLPPYEQFSLRAGLPPFPSYNQRTSLFKKRCTFALSNVHSRLESTQVAATTMTPSFASRALLAALFLGAAISSNVLAAPTPISPLSMSSNPASAGAQPAQPSPESAFSRQGSLSGRGPPEVDVPMVQRRELVHDVESTVPSQLEYGDSLGAVSKVFESDQDGTKDVTDPNTSVSFVNLKHRGGFLSTLAPTPKVTLTDEHKKTLIPILERWVKMVEENFNRMVERDDKNLKLIINKKKGRALNTARKNFRKWPPAIPNYYGTRRLPGS